MENPPPPPGQATLLWRADADTARLERLNVQGVVIESFIVDPIGTLNVPLPNTAETVIYRFVAIRGQNQDALSLPLELSCQFAWFFSEAPASLGCPSAPDSRARAAYQEFVDGFMLRLNWNGRDRVCGIQFDRDLYSCYDYEDYEETSVPATPPPDFEPPGEDFEYIFYEELAIGGRWRDVIGWARDDVDDDSLQVQPDEQGRILVYIPGEGIYRFDANLTSGPTEEIIDD